MTTEILESDWSDYDSRKTKNPDTFSCTDWEMNYLIAKIKNLNPSYPEKLIHRAVYITCRELGSATSRNKFVQRVAANLKFLLN